MRSVECLLHATSRTSTLQSELQAAAKSGYSCALGFSWTLDCERVLAGGVSRWGNQIRDRRRRRELGGRPETPPIPAVAADCQWGGSARWCCVCCAGRISSRCRGRWGSPRRSSSWAKSSITRKFDYRGVVFDVDATFQGTDEWYEVVARSRPPKHRPWYHVLVDGAEHTTYVAERHLEADERGEPIKHPLVDGLCGEFREGRYSMRSRLQ